MPKKLRPAGDLVVFKYSTLKVKITVSKELHVSAHESHHQAYKYGTIKMKNVQLLAGLYIEISCMSQS